MMNADIDDVLHHDWAQKGPR